jgi:polysaccharide export outer membrane protein
MISRAGGILPGGGKRILLLRNLGKSKTTENGEPTKPMVIDYFRLVHEGDTTQNIELQDGDVLNVPKANEIFVVGNVGRPGPVPYEDNMTILQAVTLAGGPTPTASTKSTYILRQGEKGEQKLEVRFDKILDNKEKNVVLKPDDVIVIPESFF